MSRFQAIQGKMAGDVGRRHQAAAIAYEIVEYAHVYGKAGVASYGALKEQFSAAVRAWGFTDLLEHQIRYAIRIARSSGKLEYEEMHKLFSLCGEIAALRWLGLRADPVLKEELEETLRFRFALEQRKAHLVAQDRSASWTRHWWWYKENL